MEPGRSKDATFTFLRKYEWIARSGSRWRAEGADGGQTNDVSHRYRYRYRAGRHRRGIGTSTLVGLSPWTSHTKVGLPGALSVLPKTPRRPVAGLLHVVTGARCLTQTFASIDMRKRYLGTE